MKTVNTQEAKTRLSALLAEVEDTGQPIVICRNGHPVADLVPHRTVPRSKLHPVLSEIQLSYDPVAPLEDDEWPDPS